jgi:ribonuclease T1
MRTHTWLRKTGLVLAAWLLAGTAVAKDVHGLPPVALRDLPAEAQRTLLLIEQGGPFPYPRDGVVFGNRERALPQRPRGWYREFTVPTPGERHRGARRIVAGGPPPGADYYYTDDHYASFRYIVH